MKLKQKQPKDEEEGEMKKKVIAILTATIMIITLVPTLSFAVNDNSSNMDTDIETEEPMELAADNAADVMEYYVSESEINNDVEVERDGDFSVDGTDLDVLIPGDGDEGIITETESGTIEMGLPDEVTDSEGILTDNGTVVYNPKNEDVAVGVQALSEGTGSNKWEAVRVLVEIEKAAANKEYSYNYNLPDGYKLIDAEIWYNTFIAPTLEGDINKDDYFTPGEVYIIDNEGMVIETIDPAWAYDANNNAVPTHYEVRGSELVQIVDFDENSAFPIVADPTKHPDKKKTYYLTKKQVRTIRDDYAHNDSAKIVTKGIVSLATGIVPPYGAAWVLISVANDLYDNGKQKTWKKLYKNFPDNKKYLKVVGKWKWHGGHKTYYPTGKLKTSYVKSK